MIWKKVQLGSLVDLITKGTTPTSVGYDFTDTGVNFIKIESINSNGSFIDNKFSKISEECHEALKRSQLQEGDILFSIAGALGRTAIVTKSILPANTNQALALIRLKENNLISKEFLIRVLTSESILKQVSLMKGGVAQQNLSLAQLKDFLIPLPSLAIQQKIVSKLDLIFSEIDKASAAVEANAKNTETLFQSYLTEVFERDANNSKIVLLGSVCKVIAGQSPESKNYNNEAKGLPFYQGKKDFGEVYIDSPTVWTTEITKEANKNDILMSVRAPVGPVNIATKRICIGRGLAAIRATKSINQTYLYNYLLKIEKDLIGNVGAVFNSINKTQIENLKVPLPTLPTQQKIVNKIIEIKINIDVKYYALVKKIKEFRVLKQSILKQAFNGELVKVL